MSDDHVCIAVMQSRQRVAFDGAAQKVVAG